MDRAPVKAPYRRTSVEHMGTAFRQKLSYERGNKSRIKSVPGEEKSPGGDCAKVVGWRLSLHSLCVSSMLRSTLVCSPNGPKSQDIGGPAAAEAAGVSGPEAESPPPRSVGIYAIASLNKHKTESVKCKSRHKADRQGNK